jgi:hypothetical protein
MNAAGGSSSRREGREAGSGEAVQHAASEAVIIEGGGGAAAVALRYRPGWLLCAAMLLVVCGVNGLIHGITALHDPAFFGPQTIYHNLTFWGWFFVVWGSAEVVVGWFVARGRREAIMAATALAGVAMMAWFCMVFAAPESALIGIAINGSIVWSLAAAGGLELG